MVKENSTKQEKASKPIPIGWQGLQFDLPENWNFLAESGNQREGFIRVSSLHANVELKWGMITDPTKFPTESVKAKLFKKLQKFDRKLEITAEKPSKILSHDCIQFDLKSNYQGRGLIWLCENVKKMFIVMLTAAPEHFKQATSDFDRLLDSLRCHTDEAWTPWSVFGFSFKAPSGFELKERKFLVGHGTVVLSAMDARIVNRDETQALLQYWGLASIGFGNAHSNMKLWFEDFYQRELRKRYGRKKEEGGRFRRIRVNGHTAVMLNGVFKKGWIKTQTNHSGVCMWFCPNTNRIYALVLSQIAHRRLYIPSRRNVQFPSQMFDEMVASARCH